MGLFGQRVAQYSPGCPTIPEPSPELSAIYLIKVEQGAVAGIYRNRGLAILKAIGQRPLVHRLAYTDQFNRPGEAHFRCMAGGAGLIATYYWGRDPPSPNSDRIDYGVVIEKFTQAEYPYRFCAAIRK